jgi:hypothetical protein
MGKRERLAEFWWGILKVRDLSGYLSVNWKNYIKMDFKVLVLEGMEWGKVRGTCERGDGIWF